MKRELNKKRLSFCLIISGLSLLSLSALAQSVQFQTFKTHGRMLFQLDEGVEAKTTLAPQGFEIFFKGISLSDLGAPLGEEDAWKAQFKTLQDPRIASLQFEETAGGVKAIGRWKYPQGANAPAKPEMDWFDYREKNPPKFVVDFWMKKGPTVTEVKTTQKAKAKLEAIRIAEKANRERAQRQIASTKVRASLENLTQFCWDPLNEKKDVFLAFVPVHTPIVFSKWISTLNPDSNFNYYVPKGVEKDAQYVRLAVDLYQQGKLALAIRTLDFFDTEYPRSPLRDEVKFLRANAMIRLGIIADAQPILQNLLVQAKDSAYALQSALYLALNQMEHGDTLQSLSTFDWLIVNHKSHALEWLFHMGAAEALYKLKQTERASKEYEWVLENGNDEKIRGEAALRLGDLYLDRFQYDQALAGYAQGISHFKNQSEEFAPVYINRAEALYGLGQYDRAREAFELFLQKFPTHPAGWRATYRLGEIEGRAVAESEASRKWFYETINRYPYSPGVILSRMRLIPCGDHGGFSSASSEKFFHEDASKFDGAGEVVPIRYPDYRVIAHLRSLVALGPQTKAVQVALSEAKGNTHPQTRALLNEILAGLFRKEILELLAQGKNYEALELYAQRSEAILKSGEAIRFDYLLKLSIAASDLSLGKLAMDLVGAYEKATALHKEDIGNQALDIQLTVSEENFAKAKAIWISGGDRSKVRILLDQVRAESPFSYERELMLSLLDAAQESPATALQHAAKAQLLEPVSANGLREMRVTSWLAQLQAKVGDRNAALNLYQDLENHLKLTQDIKPTISSPMTQAENLGVPPVASMEQILFSQARLLERQSRWGEASAVYARAVDQKLGGNEAQYQYAHALLNDGKKEEAYVQFSKLAAEDSKGPAPASAAAPAPVANATGGNTTSNSDFWKKLARETLANEQSRKAVRLNE